MAKRWSYEQRQNLQAQVDRLRAISGSRPFLRVVEVDGQRCIVEPNWVNKNEFEVLARLEDSPAAGHLLGAVPLADRNGALKLLTLIESALPLASGLSSPEGYAVDLMEWLLAPPREL